MNTKTRAAVCLLQDLGIEDPLRLKPVMKVTSLQRHGLQVLFGIRPRGEDHGLLLPHLRDDLPNEHISALAELAMQALVEERLFQYFRGMPEYLKILEYVILMTQQARYYGTEFGARLYLSASVYVWWMTQGDLAEDVKNHLVELFGPVWMEISGSGFEIHPINPSALRSVAALMVGQVVD